MINVKEFGRNKFCFMLKVAQNSSGKNKLFCFALLYFLPELLFLLFREKF